MSKRYSRVAVVTGATSGIGEATARKFVSCGYGVVGNGRNAEKLGVLEGEMGPAFCGVAGDAANSEVLDRLLAAASDRFGRAADIIVVNAGRGLGGKIKDTDLKQFEDLLKINVSGALALMQKAAREMMERQKKDYPELPADIVVVGSVVGRHISPFSAAYGASKFAVHALTESLRREAGPQGVRVSLIEPGLVLSGFQDGAGYTNEMVDKFKKKFGPLLIGEDVAEAVLYVVNQPPHVNISDIVVRPTRQDYP